MNDLDMMFNGKSVKQYWFTRSEVQALLKAATAPNAGAPLAAEELLDRYTQAVSNRDRMHAEYMGKAMSDEAYNRFATLRDDTIPALRKELLAHLAAAPAQQAGAPLPLTEEQREDVLDALRNTHGLAGDVEEMLDAVLEEVAAVGAPLPLAPSEAVGKYGNVLRPFVALMERELHANSSKGDRPGWLSMTRDRALLEIYYHVSKLSVAMKNDDAPAIAEHSADVANMAMMALDVCGGLATRAQPQADAADGRCGLCGGDRSVCGCAGMLKRQGL